MTDLKKQGTSAFLWDFIGKMAKNGISFIVMIFLARLLEPSDFGLIAMMMVIVGIAQIFSDIGLGGSLIQRRHVLSIHYSSVFFFNLFAGILLTLIVFLSAPWIGQFYHNDAIVPIAQVISLIFIINALTNVQNSKLRKELNYALMTQANLLSSFISGVIGITLAFNGAGIWSLVTQILAQSIIYNILIWNAAQWRPNLQFSPKALVQLWGFGFRMFLSGILDAIFTRLDYMMIGKLFSPTTLGFFQQAKSLNFLVIQYSSESLMAVLFPILSKIQHDLPRFQQTIKQALGVISFVVFLLLGGLYVTAHELIVLLFGIKWEASVYYYKILALSGFAYPISALLVNILSSRGKSKAFLRLEIYKKILVMMNFLVLYFYGIDAFLYGLVVTSIINVSWNILFASKEIHVPFLDFAYPILTQAGIAIASVLLTIYITAFFKGYMIIMFITHGTLFLISYLLLSWTLKTNAHKHTAAQIKPYLEKRRNNS